jgi:hypothetical protein
VGEEAPQCGSHNRKSGPNQREIINQCAKPKSIVSKTGLIQRSLKLKFKSQLKFRAEPFALFLIPIERFADFANGPTGKLQAVRHEPLSNIPLLDPRNIPHLGCAQSPPNALRVRSLTRGKLQWREGRLQCFPISLQRVKSAPARAVPKYPQQKFGSWGGDYHGRFYAS